MINGIVVGRMVKSNGVSGQIGSVNGSNLRLIEINTFFQKPSENKGFNNHSQAVNDQLTECMRA